MMKRIWYFFYNISVIPLLKIFFFIAPLFNEKIKMGIKDRRRLFENLIIDLAGLDRRKKMLWFHSASMGEFEQAKPIIQQIKSEKDVNIIITFFSPSGFRNSQKYPYADVVSYLPFDTAFLSKRFLNLVRPDIAIFMRYDFWPNMLWQLEIKKIPYFIVDATMRSTSKRKLPLAKSFHKYLFGGVARILAVTDEDVNNFRDFEIENSKMKAVGDTRFDRVHQKSLAAKDKKLFKDGFFGNKKVFVFGSSWESDEDVILPATLKIFEYDPDVVLIVVPHEPTVVHLEKLENYFGKEKVKSIRFSLLNNYNDEKIIVIDSIGILLTLYTYAHIAYVGGSFKQGIHNVLEPAVYGIPVIFGPKIENSLEAQTLVRKGGAFIIRNKQEAYRTLRTLLSDDEKREQAGQICSEYVRQNLGSTDRIISEINLFL